MLNKYRITDNTMPHLERLRLGAKLIPAGSHRNLNFHDHEFSELSIVLSSTDTRHLADGESCPVKRGDVILMHPGKIHAYENTDNFEIFNLLFEPEYLPLPLLDGGNMHLFSRIMDPKDPEKAAAAQPLTTLSEESLADFEKTACQLREELANDLPGKNLRSFALFLNLFTLIFRAGGGTVNAPQTDGGISEAVNYLNNNYPHKINMDKLARKTNMSRRGFFRHFKEETGFSPLQYLLQRRLSAVERLLRTTELSLDLIAERCGFCDSNHLSRHFLRHYKIPPSAFRKNFKKEKRSSR